MNIPEWAVEAALLALFPNDPGKFARNVWETTIHTILEAAAPHMLAGAWQEGHGAGWNDCLLDLENNGAKTSPNPYRPTA